MIKLLMNFSIEGWLKRLSNQMQRQLFTLKRLLIYKKVSNRPNITRETKMGRISKCLLNSLFITSTAANYFQVTGCNNENSPVSTLFQHNNIAYYTGIVQIYSLILQKSDLKWFLCSPLVLLLPMRQNIDRKFKIILPCFFRK